MKTRAITLVSATALLLASAGAAIAQSGTSGPAVGGDAKGGITVQNDTTNSRPDTTGQDTTTQGGATTGSGSGITGPAAPGATTQATPPAATGMPLDVAALRPLDGKTEGVVALNGQPADDVIGADIVDPTGAKIADIDDLLVDGSGDVRGVVASVGGLLGIGAKKVALSVDRLEPAQGDDGAYVLNATKDELKSMAEYKAPKREPASPPAGMGTAPGATPGLTGPARTTPAE